MTTSRCDRISADDVGLQFVSSEQPDTIGIEVMFGGNMLFDITRQSDGSQSIMFDDAAGAEFEIGDFNKLLARCLFELDAWAARLQEPGGIWEV